MILHILATVLNDEYLLFSFCFVSFKYEFSEF